MDFFFYEIYSLFDVVFIIRGYFHYHGGQFHHTMLSNLKEIPIGSYLIHSHCYGLKIGEIVHNQVKLSYVPLENADSVNTIVGGCTLKRGIM